MSASSSDSEWTSSGEVSSDFYSSEEEYEDVRGQLIDRLETYDPNIFSIDFEDLEDLKKIGEGNFGCVWKGTYLGTKVAVKQLLDVDDEDMHKYLEREMITLRDMRHPNIVQLMGLCKHTSGLYIVTEYIPGGNLRKKLKDKSIEMSWELRAKIAVDVSAAMAYLHSRNVIHRDLKSQNLLVDKNWKIKVCDFGFARDTDKTEVMTVCGTDEWMAPEVALGRKYDEKADVFSFGMVMTELVTREKPKERSGGRAFAFLPEPFKKSAPSDCPPELINLACEMAEFYPEKRPTFKMVLKRLRVLHHQLAKEARAERKRRKSKKSKMMQIESGFVSLSVDSDGNETKTKKKSSKRRSSHGKKKKPTASSTSTSSDISAPSVTSAKA